MHVLEATCRTQFSWSMQRWQELFSSDFFLLGQAVFEWGCWFWALALTSYMYARLSIKTYFVATLSVLFVVLCYLYCNMADLAQIQKLLKQELAPVHEKLNAVEWNLKQLTTSFEFLSTKYDQLLEQTTTANEKIAGLNRSTKTIQADIKTNRDLVLAVKNEAEELAQYMRRDCLEVAGVKPNGEYNSEDIVKNIGEILKKRWYRRKGHFNSPSVALV